MAGLGAEADAAAGVAAGWLVGLAGTGVTVAGMGTAAGTGLAGEAAAWACTGLTWVPGGKELRGDLATLGVMDTEGVGGFGSVVAFWETGGFGSCDCCCCCGCCSCCGVDTTGLTACWFCSC